MGTTSDIRIRIGILINLSYLPGSYDKRFVRNMYEAIIHNHDLSDKQINYVKVLWHKYRSQNKVHTQDNCHVCTGKVPYTSRLRGRRHSSKKQDEEKLEEWKKNNN